MTDLPYRSFPYIPFCANPYCVVGNVKFDGEEYVPRTTYLAAEEEITKLHKLNWELEKALMEERGYWLNADGTEWIKWERDIYLMSPLNPSGIVELEHIPVGEVIGQTTQNHR